MVWSKIVITGGKGGQEDTRPRTQVYIIQATNRGRKEKGKKGRKKKNRPGGGREDTFFQHSLHQKQLPPTFKHYFSPIHRPSLLPLCCRPSPPHILHQPSHRHDVADHLDLLLLQHLPQESLLARLIRQAPTDADPEDDAPDDRSRQRRVVRLWDPFETLDRFRHRRRDLR